MLNDNRQKTRTFDLAGSLVRQLFETWKVRHPRYVNFEIGSCSENSSFQCQIGDTWVKLYRSTKVVIQGPEPQINLLMEQALADSPDLRACIEGLYEEHAGDSDARSSCSPDSKDQSSGTGNSPLQSTRQDQA